MKQFFFFCFFCADDFVKVLSQRKVTEQMRMCMQEYMHATCSICYSLRFFFFICSVNFLRPCRLSYDMRLQQMQEEKNTFLQVILLTEFSSSPSSYTL